MTVITTNVIRNVTNMAKVLNFEVNFDLLDVGKVFSLPVMRQALEECNSIQLITIIIIIIYLLNCT
jgi:hypothetical protein